MSSLKPLGIPFIELPWVDSTNNYAMGLVHAGMAQHGLAVFTHEQIKGKGQLNKTWISEKGKNIAISLLFEPQPLGIQDLFLLSMAVSLAAQSFFIKHAKAEVKIKWPNDIYWRDRKAGGILIENVITGKLWKYAVAGIGLNINQTTFDALQTKAVSLKQITGQEYNPLQLAQELCGYMQHFYEILMQNPSQIIEEYKLVLYKWNETVRFKRKGEVFEGLIKDVTKSGHLVIDHGFEEKLNVGEVEWII